MVGKSDFAQMSVMDRVVLRPFYDFAALGGCKVNPRAKLALGRRLQISLSISSRVIKLLGRHAVVGIYSDACGTDGGLASVAWFELDHFVLLRGNARDAPIRSDR